MDPRSQSRKKLLDEGYKFIRLIEARDSKPHTITVCERYGAWRKLETFPSNAAMVRRANDLISGGKYLCLEY